MTTMDDRITFLRGRVDVLASRLIEEGKLREHFMSVAHSIDKHADKLEVQLKAERAKVRELKKAIKALTRDKNRATLDGDN